MEFDNLTQTNAVRVITQFTYDLRGRKTQMIDADMGTWNYAYNALGELIRQTDAKAQVTTLQYDLLGRMALRSEADLITNWYYDNPKGTTGGCGVSKGKLCQVQSANGVNENYYYDSYGRRYLTLSTIDGPYTSYTVYDSLGRVDTYATGTDASGFAQKNIFDANGYLTAIKRGDGNSPSTGTYYPVWTAGSRDAEGRVISASLGNGAATSRTYAPDTGRLGANRAWTASTNLVWQAYTYDAVGNLSRKTDTADTVVNGNYGYDALNRLTGYVPDSGTTQAYTYDALGNIRSKTGVGGYTYGGDANCSAANYAGRHALCGISGTLNASYSYDTNGNLASGNGRTLSWTSYNQPFQITEAAGTTTILYDFDHSRVKQTHADGSTTIYLNPRLDSGETFEKITQGRTVTFRHTLYAGREAVAIYEYKVTGSTATASTNYLHTDLQGSIVALTNDAGVVVARYRYDPWGK